MNKYHIYEKENERRYIEAAFLEIRDDGMVIFYGDSLAKEIVGVIKSYDFIKLLED